MIVVLVFNGPPSEEEKCYRCFHWYNNTFELRGDRVRYAHDNMHYNVSYNECCGFCDVRFSITTGRRKTRECSNKPYTHSTAFGRRITQRQYQTSRPLPDGQVPFALAVVTVLGIVEIDYHHRVVGVVGHWAHGNGRPLAGRRTRRHVGRFRTAAEPSVRDFRFDRTSVVTVCRHRRPSHECHFGRFGFRRRDVYRDGGRVRRQLANDHR